jgi:hypothetical protein
MFATNWAEMNNLYKLLILFELLLFLCNVIFIHIDVNWSQAYLSQFVSIVYKIKTNVKNNKYLFYLSCYYFYAMSFSFTLMSGDHRRKGS